MWNRIAAVICVLGAHSGIERREALLGGLLESGIILGGLGSQQRVGELAYERLDLRVGGHVLADSDAAALELVVAATLTGNRLELHGRADLPAELDQAG
jgi:hypothetical protein